MKRVTVVGAVIKEKDGQILCALRSESMSLASFWEFPGGKVEKTENHQEALKREINEELGCEIEVSEKIIEVDHQYNNLLVNLHTYWCELIEGTPVAKEHEKIEWRRLDELKELKWAPADIPTVEKIRY